MVRNWPFCLLFLFSIACQKTKIDLTGDYKPFIGEWINIQELNEEKISILFSPGGQITFKKSLERTRKFYPVSMTEESTDFYPTDIPWKFYYFTDDHNNDYKIYINPTHDTLSMFYRNISNFVYNEKGMVFLTRKK